MFKRHNPSAGAGDYSRLEQHDEEDEAYYSEQTFHHPNSVLVANHHGHCNVVPLLSQNLPATTPHHSPPHSPRASFSAATHVTRRFFQTKLPIVFRKDMASTASFSSLPPVIIADLQNGNIPEISQQDGSDAKNEQGWVIIHKRRFRGKHGIGESRHPASSNNSVAEVLIDEEIDPSDQVTCSVFVKWTPDSEQEEEGAGGQDKPYTMTISPLFSTNKEQDEDANARHFSDPIPETEERFKEIVQSVQTAIESNMQPTRISQGSSGSYFCRNSSGKIVGVFKPKNEEPYGRLNPKWTKWIHRHLFPCFFGRSCLIPNLGYLSEAAASLIDRKLGTMVVPYTDVIHISSPSFHYDYLDRRSQQGLPPKIGSFQCFLTDYKDATVFFRDHPYHDYDYVDSRAMSRSSVWGGCLGRNDDLDEDNTVLYNIHPHQLQQDEDDSDHTHVANTPMPTTPTTTATSNTYPHDTTHKSNKKPHKNVDNAKQDFKWTLQLQQQFRREFEQLVILDYLIRNTDRGLDNWMIKYCPPKSQHHQHHHHHHYHQPSSSSDSSESSSCGHCSDADEQSNKQAPSKQQQQRGHIHVAAIDNGLAFPYKHPDQWRSYPYGWIAMPDSLVNRPFSEATRKQFLPILSDPLWWRDTVREMRALFEMDDDFDEKMFQKQMAVLKGQGYNIIRTLKDPAAGPIDLVAMQRVVINQEEVLIEYDDHVLQSRGLHLQTPASNPAASSSGALDISDALPKKNSRKSKRRLRTQRSTSFDVISTASSPFYDDNDNEDEDEDEDQDEDDVDLEAGYFPRVTATTARHERKWKDKLKSGLSMDLGGAGLFGKKKKSKNRYRAFDSDGDISDRNNDTDSLDSQYEQQREQKPKRVTVVMETIEIVKSRTYFTCC
ncbi:phosphatidylinositol 3 and 4-kinase-domain-containing protein [Parasitella parasitica]|nr:phosphatidylinositol 3 and 4-kinase-domain-containing protein [Parasitella parasitica]